MALPLFSISARAQLLNKCAGLLARIALSLTIQVEATPSGFPVNICRTGCCVLPKTPSHVSIPGNQNGTMAKDALLPEKFISAECVR